MLTETERYSIINISKLCSKNKHIDVKIEKRGKLFLLKYFQATNEWEISDVWCWTLWFLLIKSKQNQFNSHSLLLPRSITVVGEGESSDPQSLESSQHSKTGANGVAGFHGDNAGYLTVLVRINQLCKTKENYFY